MVTAGVRALHALEAAPAAEVEPTTHYRTV
jgi:hypothetical protein